MSKVMTQMTQEPSGWYPEPSGWYPMTQMTQAHQVANRLAANRLAASLPGREPILIVS
jgi:hypothetical protein